mgnify:FL=1|jgi:hypothetical protein
MISAENLYSNLLTVTILFGLTLIVYAKMAKKTLPEIIRDVREGFSDKSDEVYERVPVGFDGIR